jgi:hypothetical protein
MTGNCNIDVAEQWSTVTAYFEGGTFVGYGTWAADGEALLPGNFETAIGLSVSVTPSHRQSNFTARRSRLLLPRVGAGR